MGIIKNIIEAHRIWKGHLKDAPRIANTDAPDSD
jgi:hypothetical protein